jgi:hypothetical protein
MTSATSGRRADDLIQCRPLTRQGPADRHRISDVALEEAIPQADE